ncbi:DUF3515 domain-containing protein [Nonomuraea sp. KC401]|uniref:DUF3515 family protein n=1 Tax=unclassified Nonomuraea TaxID=2593643 RepID=UPI0010FDC22E|nr:MULTISPECIES: DUF3515 family protein [unclassified Nonomuraea]NBE96120.1 DUF3515 family protein [Nonomuraea sp. K271]TLF80316.1 DUF3515 domain-containing protein [Nonomuraea sp. KC401]
MRAATVLLALLTLAGCGTVQVDPPTPQGEAVAACDKLAGLLPETLDGDERGTSTPESPYVAVWGEGTIALRCGVGRPARMAPTDQLREIGGVGWFADPDRPTLFTAVTDTAYVEVTVGGEHVAAEVLADLSEPIARMAGR